MRGRGDRLEELIAERELDRMLVTDLTNVRYLTGFTGTNGACVCGPGVRVFLTDFRYTERAAAEVEGWEPVTVEGDWLAAIAERLEGRVGFEDDQMAVRSLAKLEEKLGEGVEAVPAGGAVESLRRVKDAEELAAIEAASRIADEVWRWSAERGLAGRTEREVARAAEARIRELGGDPSFPAIVAAGPNGALPHAEPGEEARAVYATVLEAQLASLEAVQAGAKGEDVDAVARKVIDAAGHKEHFGHGLGHGVGLEVHEGPRLSPRSDDLLAPGEVVTVEPGIYLPGKLGVRIEDFVVVEEDGYRNLSTLPKELTLVE